MKLYPRHDIKCIIHVNPELCNCGTEEVEEDLASEETKAETQEDDSDEGRIYDT